MMENAFTVAVRRNICPVCKSARLLESERRRLQKTLLRQPRYIFVQITCPIKLRCGGSKLLMQILEQFVARRKLQSVFVSVCFWVFY